MDHLNCPVPSQVTWENNQSPPNEMHIHQQNHWNDILSYWYQFYHWYQWTITSALAVYIHHQTVMRRFKFPVPDKERMLAINRALSVVCCFSPNSAVSSAGSLSGKYKLQSAPKSPFLKKIRLIMPWDRKVSKTVRPLLDWQSKISPKYYWAESLFLSVHSRSGHMFNFLTHAGLIHVTYIKYQ